MEKSLDRKLAAIHRDPAGCREFILADAKDADMAFGIGAPGRSPEMHAGEVRFRTLEDYREQIRQVVRQGLVDIMLMSASTNEVLALGESLFENSAVTPAARANDTSDIFVLRGAGYVAQPAQPFRSTTIDHIQCGRVECASADRRRGANLGLYSVTFNNRLEDDLHTLERYREFRLEAERKGFRHFLEVFDPNAPHDLSPEQIPAFVNDAIARTLAGVVGDSRPLFLKVVYHGPRAMEELVAYDPHLIVGILGGGAGTTYDAFKLLSEARKYGARVALFGRKINQAENQLAFVEFLRLIADGKISAEEAVRAYHGVLEKLRIRPLRPLHDDLQLMTQVMSYGGGSQVAMPAALPATPRPGAAANSSPTPCACRTTAPATSTTSCQCGGEGKKKAAMPSITSPASGSPPDFRSMTPAEKLAYNQAQRDRLFGRFRPR